MGKRTISRQQRRYLEREMDKINKAGVALGLKENKTIVDANEFNFLKNKRARLWKQWSEIQED